jgi:hypothetical protein
MTLLIEGSALVPTFAMRDALIAFPACCLDWDLLETPTSSFLASLCRDAYYYVAWDNRKRCDATHLHTTPELHL